EGAASGRERAEAHESCDRGARRGAPEPHPPGLRFTRLGAHPLFPLGDPPVRLIVESRVEIIARGELIVSFEKATSPGTAAQAKCCSGAVSAQRRPATRPRASASSLADPACSRI